MTVPLTLLAIFFGCIGISFLISGFLTWISAIDFDEHKDDWKY